MPYGYKVFVVHFGDVVHDHYDLVPMFYPLLKDNWYAGRAECFCPILGKDCQCDGARDCIIPCEYVSGCGFYSFKTFDNAASLKSVAAGLVIAKVWACGRVIEHNDGYRSEYIQVLDIL